jgi:hypothetical protein
MEYKLGTLSEVIEMRSSQTERREVISMLPSSGGRPAYNITKEQIEQLRETGGRASLTFFVYQNELCIGEESNLELSLVFPKYPIVIWIKTHTKFCS